MSKTALITGTSTGLGLATAVLLARNGFMVYATMRDLAKQDALLEAAKSAGVSLNVLALDVTDTASIKKCVATILEIHGHLDLLVNNAGAGFAKTTEQATEEEMAWVTDVNYHGVVRCTKAVLPGMRERRSGHIINVTSVGGLVGQPFNDFYCAAKFAVEGYTEALASYVTPSFNVHFTCVEPGGISTEFSKSAVAATVTENGMAEGEYLPVIRAYLDGMRNRAGKDQAAVMQTPEQVAEVILRVAESENPPLRTRTSEWGESLCRFKTQADPEGMKQTRMVWKEFLGK